jgi:MerR family transcriptional regulator, thiopeptide resistance regulator
MVAIMARGRSYQVKDLAEIAGISVRTLHHYDELGLLVPSARSDSGYRLYSDDDLLRLQQIMVNRELGLPLEEIRRMLDDPGFDRRQALVAQRAELAKRARQTDAMLRAVDAALARLDTQDGAHEKGETMDDAALFEGFDPSKYEAEAEQRWGGTEEFRESKRRTRNYTKEDWQRITAEQAAIYADAFQARQAGKSPDDPRAMDVAERHRLSIDRWFYPCDHEMHGRLAALYEQDSRFAANIDKFGAGLTPFLAEAIRQNARRHGG